MLANLIEKYAAVLDIDNLPEPPICLYSAEKEIVNNPKLFMENKRLKAKNAEPEQSLDAARRASVAKRLEEAKL